MSVSDSLKFVVVVFLLLVPSGLSNELLLFSGEVKSGEVVNLSFSVVSGSPYVPGNGNGSNFVALLDSERGILSSWRFPLITMEFPEFTEPIELNESLLFFRVPLPQEALYFFIGGENLSSRMIPLTVLCEKDGICGVGESKFRCPLECGGEMKEDSETSEQKIE